MEFLQTDLQANRHHIIYISVHWHYEKRIINDYGDVNIIMIMLTSTWPIMWSLADRDKHWIMSTSFQPIRSRDFSRRYDNIQMSNGKEVDIVNCYPRKIEIERKFRKRKFRKKISKTKVFENENFWTGLKSDRTKRGRHDFRGLTIHYVCLLTIWHLFCHIDDQPWFGINR